MQRPLSLRPLTRYATTVAVLSFVAPFANAAGLAIGTEILPPDRFIADLKACTIAAGEFSTPTSFHMVQRTDGTTYAIRALHTDTTKALELLQKTITDNTADCPEKVRMTR